MESCLLCLELNNENIDSIKVNSTQWQELDIEGLIEKHLWPMHTLQLSSLLCGTCWEQLYEFHKFYKRIKNAQMNFGTLMKIEIANNKSTIRPEIEFTPESIIEEDINEEHEEDSWSEEMPLQQIKDMQNVSNTNATIMQDPLDIAAKLNNVDVGNLIEFSLNKVQPEEQRSSEKLTEDEIKPETAPLKDIKEFYEDFYSNSDSDSIPIHEPVKKPTLARSNFNKQKDKFITENFVLICEICKIPMETFYELSKHFARKHQRRPFVTCCTKKFYERSYLLHHLKQHLNPNCYKCKDCNKICETPEILRVHSKTHDKNRTKDFCCDVCGLSFYNNVALARHKRNHLKEDEKSFPCSKCEKSFFSDFMLKKHIRQIHGVHLTCNFCGLECDNRFFLAKHIDLEHTMNVKEYVCTICSKISPNQQSHERHIKDVHEPKEDFIHKCTLCEKSFKEPRALKQHISSMHKGISLKKCLWCSQMFKRDSYLFAHGKKTHPKEWEEYEREKIAQEQLVKDVLGTTGDMYKCTSCDKSFKKLGILKQHISCVHKDTPLKKCLWCLQTFKRDSNLSMHGKKRHPKEWEEYVREKNSGILPPN